MLKKSVALVTGCGSGLGRATLRRFVQEGARVAGIDINEETGSQIQDLGGDVLFCKADLSDETQVQGALKQVEEKYGHLNVVVNCAGVSLAFPVFNANKWTLDKFHLANDLIANNLMSTFNVCRLSVPLISKSTPDEDGAKGVIINSSGFLASEGNVTQAFMAGTCGAINSMTLPLSRDLFDEGIRVVTISPGIFESPLTEIWPNTVTGFFKNLCLHPYRLGHLDEYADHAVNIVNNKMLNGVVIRLDAGFRNNY